MKKIILGLGLCAILLSASNLIAVNGTTLDSSETTEEQASTEEQTESTTEDNSEEATEEVTEESTTEEIATETLSSVYSLNNYVKNIDFKLSDAVVKELKKSAPKTDIVEDVAYADTSQNLNNLSVEKSWLINNNIVSRAGTYSDDVFTYNKEKDTDYYLKSELWMSLAKIGYGTINSRTLVINKPRATTYIDEYVKSDGTIVHADASAGDYYVYVTPNVYELYFSRLLDKGLITKSEFNTSKGKKFVKDYESYTATKSNTTSVPWVTSKGSIQNTSDSIFGYSTKQTNNGKKIVEKAPSYFNDEQLYTIDALKIIETYMRATEKEMTEFEASIVSYKYGIHYVNDLSDDDKKTVEFLIAKGVLNYEDSSEMVNIYGVLTREIAYKLLYRVAKPDARFDFSKITLTDQESFWQEKGFYENKMNIYDVAEVPIAETISEVELQDLKELATQKSEDVDNSGPTEEELDNDFIDDLLSFRNPVKVYAASTSKFKVRKMFDTKYDYKYGDTSIKDLKVGDEIYKIDNITLPKDAYGNKAKVKVVTFEVSSKNAVSALAYVNNKITSDMKSITKTEVVGYTTIEDVNGALTTLISETTLQRSFSNISIVEDKLLMNQKTGTEAILLPDSGYALVGNQVIVTDEIIVKNTNGELYYNLDIIAALMENTVLKKLTSTDDNNSDSVYKCDSIVREKIVDVTTSEATQLGKASLTQIKTKVTEDDNRTSKKTFWFFNQSQLDKGINSLIRQYKVKLSNGEEETVTFIVDWQFIVLGNELLGTDVVKEVNESGMTIAGLNAKFYTRPSETAAAEWWDSNISMSNSLANFMYGTSGVKYVTNGYLAPSLTVLKSKNVSEALVAKIFKQNGFKLDSTGKKYCSNTSKFWESYFQNPIITGDGLKEAAIQYRTFNMFNATKTTDGLQFGEWYFMTNYNVLYKQVNADGRVYTSDGNGLTVNTRNENNSISGVTAGEKFTYLGKEWIYLGVENGKYIVQPNFTESGRTNHYGMLNSTYNPCIITITSKSGSNKGTKNYAFPFKKEWFEGSVSLIKLQDNKTLEDRKSTNGSASGDYYYKFTSQESTQIIRAMKEEIEVNYYDVYFPGCSTPAEFLTPDEIFSLNSATTCLESDRYYHAGSTGFVNIKGETLDPTASNFSSDLHTDSSRTVGALPKLYINTADYYFTESNGTKIMCRGTLSAHLNATEISYIGISRKVIDSIVAKFSCICKLEDLRDGQKVYVGDLLLTKVGNGSSGQFVSEPIQDSKLVNGIKYGNDEERKSAIVEKFVGQTITYSGNTCSLTSYITDADAGTYLKSNTITDGVIWKDNSVYKIKQGTTDTTDMTTSAQYACIAITFQKGLLAQPISADGSTYRLLTVSGISGNDFVDNIPFYYESLSFARGRNSSIAIGQALDSTFQFFKEARDTYKEMMRKAFNGDIISIIWSIIYSFASYLCVMCWILYAMLKYDVGRKYFKILTMPSSGGHGYRRSSGFDIIRFVSLGIYDVDSEPTLSRTLTLSFVCFFIMYSILHWL